MDSLEQDCNGPRRRRRIGVLGYDDVPQEQSTAYQASMRDLDACGCKCANRSSVFDSLTSSSTLEALYVRHFTGDQAVNGDPQLQLNCPISK